MNEFGHLVREKRIAANLGLRQFAKMLDISPTYLSHIEVGHVPPPSPEKICLIAEHLSVDQEALLELVRDPHKKLVAQMALRPDVERYTRLAFAMTEEQLEQVMDRFQSVASQLQEQLPNGD